MPANQNNNSNFWSNATAEPKRQYRWIVRFAGAEEWIAKSVKKPTFSVSESEHSFINYKFYYPGRVEWQTVDLTIVDPVNPDSTQSLFNLILNAGYVLPKDFTAEQSEAGGKIQTVSKGAYTEAVGDITIEQMDPAGEKIEEWRLVNAWFTNVDFGTLDYTSDELVEISVTVRYDFAVLNDSTNSGITGVTPWSQQARSQ